MLSEFQRALPAAPAPFLLPIPGETRVGHTPESHLVLNSPSPKTLGKRVFVRGALGSRGVQKYPSVCTGASVCTAETEQTMVLLSGHGHLDSGCLRVTTVSPGFISFQ